jgi:hypothetical protein
MLWRPYEERKYFDVTKLTSKLHAAPLLELSEL